mgnify:CR=1 FL=1
MAASNGRAEVVKALVAAGARADTADKVSPWLAAPAIALSDVAVATVATAVGDLVAEE